MQARAIAQLFPGIDFETECILVDEGRGAYIAKWNRPEKQPTDAEIEAAQVLADAAEQAAATLRVEAATAKDDAKRALAALDTIITGIDGATLAQAKAAIKQEAQILRHLILATLGR